MRPVAVASLLLGAALAVSGCATSLNKLSSAEIASLRIVDVDIRYASNSRIRWHNAKHDYLRQPAVAAEVQRVARKAEKEDAFEQGESAAQNTVMNSPEAKAYMRKRLSALIETHLAKDVLPRYQGTRPVRLEVTVHGFFIPSPVARVVVGGSPTFAAITVLKDAGTGAELAKLDRLAAGYAGAGLLGVALDQAGADLEDRVLKVYTANIQRWLKAPSSGRRRADLSGGQGANL